MTGLTEQEQFIRDLTEKLQIDLQATIDRNASVMAVVLHDKNDCMLALTSSLVMWLALEEIAGRYVPEPRLRSNASKDPRRSAIENAVMNCAADIGTITVQHSRNAALMKALASARERLTVKMGDKS